MLFLMPAVYYGEDSGLAVCLAGLEDGVEYDSMTLSLDDGAMHTVLRDKESPFFSEEYSFGGLRRGQIYQVTGVVVTGDNIQEASVLLPAQQGQAKPSARRMKAKTTKEIDGKGSGTLGGMQSTENRKEG